MATSKSKRDLAEVLSKTFVRNIQNHSSVYDRGINERNAFTVGYLESFLAMLMAENQKVMMAVSTRLSTMDIDTTKE